LDQSFVGGFGFLSSQRPVKPGEDDCATDAQIHAADRVQNGMTPPAPPAGSGIAFLSKGWKRRAAFLIGIASCYGSAMAAEPGIEITVVTPNFVQRPPPEIAPGGVVVLRGGGQLPKVPQGIARGARDIGNQPVPSLSPAGWDRNYDTSGSDRRFDTTGFDRWFDTSGFDRRFDPSGFDRRFDTSGFDRRFDTSGFDRAPRQ
jgi:hypothetical protein